MRGRKGYMGLGRRQGPDDPDGGSDDPGIDPDDPGAGMDDPASR